MNWLVISPTYYQDLFTCTTDAFKDARKDTPAVYPERFKVYPKEKEAYWKRTKPNQIQNKM